MKAAVMYGAGDVSVETVPDPERTDEYGGTLENRARLLLRVTDAVRAVIPAGMPLLVRLSATEWVEGGFDLEETGQVGRWLGEHGVDLLDISTGGNITPAPIPVGPGYQTPAATAVRAASKPPVGAVGLIDAPFQAEQILAAGVRALPRRAGRRS